ncbi:MAG: CapA family protein [Thermoleophilia bacterium]|nr:CapA family protein [Thermoleophilia bacterium]
MSRSQQELRERRRQARRRVVMRRRVGAVGVLGLVVAGVVAVASGGGGDGAQTASADAGATTRARALPPPRTPDDPSRRISISATGDVMMGTPQFGLPADGGRGLFAQVAPLLTGDVVFGNLEGTLTTRGASKCGSGSPNCFAFRSPPSYVANLTRAGYTVVNLANNHGYDFGDVGVSDTVAALTRAKLAETGRPGRYAVLDLDGAKVAVLGFTTYRWGNRMERLPAVRRLVAKAAAEADLVIVSMHAGAEGRDATHVRSGTEFFLGENRGDVKAFSRAAIDAGADLVVGHGPHVLRGMEFYRGRLIAYSLGNFLGWKAFSLSGASGVSGVLQVTLRADGTYVSGRLRPTVLAGGGAPRPGGDGVARVARLSREDFGRTAARISADGAIRRPAAAG